MEMLLEIKKVSKRFGGLWALKNIDINVDERKIIGIIGPNGAGKTTLFNVITGVYKSDGGKIIFDGRDVTGWPPYKVNSFGIARTFQVTRPFKNLTVLENVLVSYLSKEKKYEEAMKKAEDVLRTTGLYDKRNSLAKDLNILDQKRLELARAVATKPKLLLLDEAMAGLKPGEMDELFEMIHELNRGGLTIVIVEHVMKIIQRICDRVIVLHHGEKIAEGTPEEISRNELVIKAYLGEEYAAGG